MIKRPPDRVIGDAYMSRWHILPRNRFLNIYLHRYIGSDEGRDLHDHEYASVSFLLKGRLIEISPMPHGFQHWKHIKRFVPVFRRATFAHRIILLEGPAWTVFVTGPRTRKWGFITPDGWVHHKRYLDGSRD